jgi:hypothetical protein
VAGRRDAGHVELNLLRIRYMLFMLFIPSMFVAMPGSPSYHRGSG